MIFDTHAHYDDARFDGIRDEIIKQLPKNDVAGVINCAVDIASAEVCINLAHTYDFFYAAVGYHPENITADTVFDKSKLSELAADKKAVAIGEIGLDYYWSTDNKELQKQFFENQVIFANEHNLPVIIHDREAHADTLDIIKRYNPGGVVHCFSGSAEMAREIIKTGMYIGVGGVLTFKNAKKIQEVAKSIPLDRMLLETDAPYMAPEPHRGKINNSAYIKFVAEKLAELRGDTTENILKITKENAEKLFNI